MITLIIMILIDNFIIIVIINIITQITKQNKT